MSARDDTPQPPKHRRRVVTLRDGDAVTVGDVTVRRVSARQVEVSAPEGRKIDLVQRPPVKSAR